MNTGYLIYQAERPRSGAEQRQVDIAHAELARAVSRRWHTLAAPLRALRPRRRSAGRRPGLPVTGIPAAQIPAAECLATECLAGRPA
jgi:hypothetical protein